MAELVTTFQGHDNYVIDVLFSPDGTTLISSGMDAKIKIWVIKSWILLKTLGDHKKSVNSLSISKNGKLLASSSTDLTAKIWSLPSGQQSLKK